MPEYFFIERITESIPAIIQYYGIKKLDIE